MFRQPGWVGCAVAFLALCKVGLCRAFVCLAMCLKIAWVRVGEVMDA